MLGSKKQQERIRNIQDREDKERFERNEQPGADIYKRTVTLRKNPSRTAIAYNALTLLKEAQHLEALIRQSIKDRTHYDFDIGDPSEDGDLATRHGEDIVYAVRKHLANPQTIWQALSDQLPDVHFSIHEQDVISMISATIRIHFVAGIIEGLELAGVPIPRG